MLIFCPACSNLLIPSRAQVSVDHPEGINRLECQSCPYHFLLQKRYVDRTYMKRKEVEDVMGGPGAWDNVDQTEAQCPSQECTGDRAFFYMVQIRSADEPMTTFFKASSASIMDSCDILTFLPVH
ncbi:MAG: RNA polymerase III C11 subunit [Trizodia sp. TS-e1964]|nr:MAG: RNA polymerase III C11 subunit [Trizodia sp. TS-e1964]